MYVRPLKLLALQHLVDTFWFCLGHWCGEMMGKQKDDQQGLLFRGFLTLHQDTGATYNAVSKVETMY